MIVDYLGRTYRKLNPDVGNVELYGTLAARLEEIRRGEQKKGRCGEKKRMIILE